MGAPLSGTYSIDPSGGGNYKTFALAVADLQKNGVNGPCIFKVSSGYYKEQINIKPIKGASSTNSITFISSAQDSTKVTIIWGTNNGGNYIWQLDSADNIHLKKMTLLRVGSDTSRSANVITLKGDANNNLVESCILVGVIQTSAINSNAVIFSPNSIDESNIIRNNVIRFGYAGIYFSGASSTSLEKSNIIEQNRLDSFYSYGIYINYQENSQVINNSVLYAINKLENAIYGSNCLNGGVISGNKVSTYNIGISVNSCSGISASNPFIVANNMVTSVAYSVSSYGIYCYNNAYLLLGYNSVNMSGSPSAGAGLYCYAGTSNVVENNCLNINSGSSGCYSYVTSNVNNIISSDYNNFNSKSGNIAFWNSTSYNSVSSLSSASGMDSNSISVDPKYMSPTNLHTKARTLNGAANPNSKITYDFDGELRSTSTPDIGADEFNLSTLDASIIRIDSPVTGMCSGLHQVTVGLSNLGTDTLKNVTINWTVNGTAQTPLNWSGNLAFEDTEIVTLGNYNFGNSTSYSLICFTSKPNGGTDGDNSNDTSKISDYKSALSGNFTVGGTSSDYTTLVDAVKDLVKRGVCSATIFNITDGDYSEQFSIPQITGSSPTNSITFQSQSGDSSKVNISFNSTINNYVLQLDGADFLRIKKVTFKGNGNLINILGGANNNEISGCRLIGSRFNITYSVNNTGADMDTSNQIIGNYFNGGFYGCYMFCTTAPYESSNQINNNFFDSLRGPNVYLYNQKRHKINGNTFINFMTTTNAINNYYSRGYFSITNNKIIQNKGGNSIYSYYSYLPSVERGLIANNFIAVKGIGGTANGIYNVNSDRVDIYYNSILIHGTSTGSAALYKAGYNTKINSSRVKNNILWNDAGGLGIYQNDAVDTSDNNDIYSSGLNLAYWNGTLCTDIADLQGASGMDSNSISVNPWFVSTKDLHTQNPLLNGAADALLVNSDIDNQTRDNLFPDIGADEFDPVSNDVGVFGLDSPFVGNCSGTHNIIISIVNFGLNNVTSVNIIWSVNGSAQTNVSWTGNLLPGEKTSINLGPFTFSANTSYLIQAKTNKPNGLADGNGLNDKLEFTYLAGMNGTYTIGGTSPDFNSFNDAITALTNRGVCGKTVFNVGAGTYTEHLQIGDIVGSSSLNSITFQGPTGDSTLVTLTNPLTPSFNYIINFNGCDWVSFKSMSIKSGVSYAFLINNGSHRNTISNNYITGLSSSVIYGVATVGANDRDTALTIDNNHFSNLYYGISLYGNALNNNENYHKITNNIIDSCTGFPINLNYQNNAIVSGNKIQNTQSSNTCMNLTMYKNELEVSGNTINSTKGGTGINLFTSYFGQTKCEVYNNFISINSTVGIPTYGIFKNYGDSTGLYHNNINIYGPGNNSSALHDIDTNYQVIKNNNLVNSSGGYSFYLSGSNQNLKSDYNNLYATGSNTCFYNGSSYANLGAWQTATGLDSNSLTINPSYASNTNLHVNAKGLDSTATPIAFVTNDIDNQSRDLNFPDIGADEFTPLTDDAGIIGIDSPYASCKAQLNVYASVKNYGITDLTSVTIGWSINGISQTSFNWTGSIKQDSFISQNIGSFNFASGVTYYIKVWTENPNGGSDGKNSNDTSIKAFKKAMSGVYIIGGTNPDYKTFNDAISALNSRGVCGAVSFHVRAGTYKEQITLKQVNGASLVNTITFQGIVTDSTKVVLWFHHSGNSPNAVVYLNGGDFYRFKSLTILSRDTGVIGSYGSGFYITSGATDNAIQSCFVQSNALYGYPIYITPNGNGNDNLLIKGNVFRGSYYGIYNDGYISSTQNQRNVQIINNVIDSFDNYGIYSVFNDSTLLQGNLISHTGINSSYGIYASNDQNSLRIIGNKIFMPNGNYGIYAGNCPHTSASQGWVYNNFITVGGTQPYGIQTLNNDYLNFDFNNIRIIGTASSSYAYYQGPYATTPNTVQLYSNNIINEATGGFGIYLSSKSSLAASDYNNITANGKLGYYSGTFCSTLSAWQLASKLDLKSLSVDPQFVSSSDLHIKNKALDNAAYSKTGITTDIDNQQRGSIPDIGADEFFNYSNDLAITNIITPQDYDCGDSNALITITISNYGLNNQNNVYVYADISGIVNTTFGDTISSIGAGTSRTKTFASTLNTYSGGALNLKVYHSLSNDGFRKNDTLSQNFNINKRASTPIANNVVLCGKGAATLIGKHASGESLRWYNNLNDLKPFATGDTVGTSFLSVRDTYWVEALDTQTKCTGSRIPVIVYIGGMYATIIPDTSMYNGSLNPDIICEGNGKAGYELKTGFSNASYDTTWTIPSWSFKTSSGTSATNVSFTYPTSSSNAKIAFTPTNSETDSTFILQIAIHDKLNGCDDTVYRSVYVSRNPTAKFGTNNVCFGTSVSFKDSSKAGIGSYTNYYDFGDGTTSTSFSPSHKYASAGTFIVKLICTNKNGCADLTSRTITVYDKPQASFGTSNACLNQPLLFEDSSTTQSGKIIEWNYTFGDGGKASTQNPTHTYTQTGNFTAKLVVKNSHGCLDSVTRIINVLNSPSVGFTTGTACLGDSTVFNNSSTAASFYEWDFGDAQTSSDKSPIHLYSKAGAYHVILKATNASGCFDTIGKTVYVSNKPVANFITPSSGCTGEVISFTDKSSGLGLSYSWDFGDGSSGSISSGPTHIFSKKGTYKVTQEIKAGTCSDTISKFIVVSEAPKVKWGISSGICVKSPVQFHDSSTIGSGNLTYRWDFGDGSAISAVQNPTHTYNVADSFDVSLTVTSSNGCSVQLLKTIIVNSLPNITFSPTAVKRDLTFHPSDTTLASYNWDFGDGAKSTKPTPTHLYASDGNYTVQLTVVNKEGCSQTITNITKVTVGIDNLKWNDFQINIQPNPFSEYTTISFFNPRGQNIKLELLDITGKEIFTIADKYHAVSNFDYMIKPEDAKLQAGLYLLKLSTEDGMVVRQILKLKQQF